MKDFQESETRYMVARLSIDTNYKWVVTYYGEVPEQGGIETKWDTLEFEALEDALDFLDYQVSKHEQVYVDLMDNKEADKAKLN